MIDAMIERRTQAILDRLDGLLGYRSGSGNTEAHSKEATRKPVVNFIGSTGGRGNPTFLSLRRFVFPKITKNRISVAN